MRGMAALALVVVLPVFANAQTVTAVIPAEKCTISWVIALEETGEPKPQRTIRLAAMRCGNTDYRSKNYGHFGLEKPVWNALEPGDAFHCYWVRRELRCQLPQP